MKEGYIKEGYIINENAVRIPIAIPNDAVNMTESYNSSRTVALMKKQFEEQRRQNCHQFIFSVITSLVSIGALVISMISLFRSTGIPEYPKYLSAGIYTKKAGLGYHNYGIINVWDIQDRR